jgi:uncharacterized protein YuzE
MKLTFEYDSEDGQILAAYLEITEGKVSRTVEVAEGECYADEDAEGKLVGVELLCLEHLSLLVENVANRYPVPSVRKAFSTLREAVAA